MVGVPSVWPMFSRDGLQVAWHRRPQGDSETDLRRFRWVAPKPHPRVLPWNGFPGCDEEGAAPFLGMERAVTTPEFTVLPTFDV